MTTEKEQLEKLKRENEVLKMQVYIATDVLKEAPKGLYDQTGIKLRDAYRMLTEEKENFEETLDDLVIADIDDIKALLTYTMRSYERQKENLLSVYSLLGVLMKKLELNKKPTSSIQLKKKKF